jgi:hypothetical protein
MSILGNKTTATSSTYENPTEYEFQYKVVDLDSLIPSHTDALLPNSKYYPKELQPRARDRSASRVQIDRIAKQLNPKGLLNDTGHIDTGIMIIGKDSVVESGNGRILALRKARTDFPDRFAEYERELIGYAKEYGIDVSKLDDIKYPVLVRQRITPVDRVAFTAEANAPATMSMSPHEQALQDAGRLSNDVLMTLEVGEDQTIDQALKSKSNQHIVNAFVTKIPANERASISDAKGELSIAGLTRLKSALFAKTYTGASGERLARTFSESLEPTIKNVENAMFASLPAMAKAQGLIAAGYREADLLPARDLAKAIEVYATLKQKGMSVSDYLAQGKMFGNEINPLQEQILTHLDTVGRSGKSVREFINDIAGRIEKAPMKGQASMLGDEVKINKEVIINGAINEQRKDKGLSLVAIPDHTAESKELERPAAVGTESTSGVGKPAPSELGKAVKPTRGEPEVVQLGNFFATERTVVFKNIKKGKRPHSVRTTIHYGTGKDSGGRISVGR